MSVGRDVAVVLVAFSIEVLDGRNLLGTCASALDEPETTFTVSLDAYVRRDSSISTVERLEECRGNSAPLLSCAKVVNSAVEGCRSNLFYATLSTENIHLQGVAFTLDSQADCRTVLLVLTYVCDTCSLVELTTLEDGLPSLVEVVGIDFPYRAVGQTGCTAYEETTILSEAEVLEVEVVAAEELERCAASNVETAIVSTYRLEGGIECEECTRIASREHVILILHRTRLGDENLTEALACRIVVDSQAIRRVEAVALAYLQDVESTLTNNCHLELQLGNVGDAKSDGTNAYLISSNNGILYRRAVNLAFAIVEVNLCRLYLGIEVEVDNNIVTYLLSRYVVSKRIELRIGHIVDVLATIEVNHTAFEEARNSILTDGLEPNGILA